MSIDEILEEMDELLDKASSMPLMGHKKIIDGERMRELINDIRLNQPHELKKAKQINFDCQRILNEAKGEAAAVIVRAEERAAKLVAQEVILQEAKKKAIEIIQKAQQTSQNLQKAAMNSITRMFSEAERIYTKNLQEIKAVKNRMSTPENAANPVNKLGN